MDFLGYNILNFIVWHKPDPPHSLTDKRFDFSAEYIIWASKDKTANHYFNKELMSLMNDGKPMQDVWTISAAGQWEKMYGKHPTQKPLQLLYRIIFIWKIKISNSNVSELADGNFYFNPLIVVNNK